MFIHEAKTLVDFADQIQDLAKLLQDPKKLKSLVTELADAEEIFDKRKDALKSIAESKSLSAVIDKREKDTAIALDAAKAALADAEKTKEDLANIKKEEINNNEIAKKSAVSAKENEDKSIAALKRAEEKSAEFDKRNADVSKLKLELESSIAKYNDAVKKLALVKVA